MNKQTTSTILIASILIIVAAMSRVLLYPHNFSPIIGMAIFAGASIKDKRLAFALPILAMFLSDVLFEVFNIAPGFWGWGQLVSYSILALITVIAFTLKKISVLKIAGYSVGSSLLFFLLSNSAFFVIDNPIYHLYAQNFNGYIATLVAGIPFLKTSLVADLVYSGVLFGAYYLIQNYIISTKKVAA
ncbi:MAG: DUF6580 family putative transport protein [Ferruginibacter sp.]|nr:hypothetical protein [Bacteroidota bacterium]MCB0710150.1 hypothetical protein [Chitinophagaceae bacterium]